MPIHRRFVLLCLISLALLVFQQQGLAHAYAHEFQIGQGQVRFDIDHGVEEVCGVCLALVGMGNGLARQAAPVLCAAPSSAVSIASGSHRATEPAWHYTARAPPVA
ncbi:MAG: hypothetical protein RBS40_01860 [Rhodocyclaceae bacterium]|nr:hypothetical protein [Rhodocyclaceae bacterium]